MEILNNIWPLLTTPNELNTKIITFPCTFLEVYIMLTLFLTILNIHPNKKNKFLFVFILSTFTILSENLIPAPINSLINNLLSFVLFIILFKVTPFKTLIGLVSSVAIFSIISSLIATPYISLLNITLDELFITPIYDIGFLLCVYMANFLLILILKFRTIELNTLEDIDNKNKKIIFINFIFGIFALIVQGCIIFYFIDKLPMIITFLSCISLLAYFFINVYSLTRVMKLILTTKKLESAEEYNKTLHILHDNVRGFKHDFDNIVTTIGGYIRTTDMGGLKSYYLQLEDDCQ